MAKATIEISVEQVIHNAIRTVLEEIREKHGVQINSIYASWIDVSTHADPNAALCNMIDMCTTSRAKNPEA